MRISDWSSDVCSSDLVLGAIFRRKAEVGVEAAADVVAIQHVDLVALGEELLLDLHGQGRLASAGKAGEPQHTAVVTVAHGAAIGREAVLDRDDVDRKSTRLNSSH